MLTRRGALTFAIGIACVALTLIACGNKTVINPAGPTPSPGFFPTPTPVPSLFDVAVAFRVTGNASQVRVLYSTPVDGLAQVITTPPYTNGFHSTASSLFLSLEATPIQWQNVTFPFLSVQIVVNDVVFREATSRDFLFAPLAVSGTWRR